MLLKVAEFFLWLSFDSARVGFDGIHQLGKQLCAVFDVLDGECPVQVSVKENLTTPPPVGVFKRAQPFFA